MFLGVKRVASWNGCNHPHTLPAAAHSVVSHAFFCVLPDDHGTGPSEPCTAEPKCPLWIGVGVRNTTPSLCPRGGGGSSTELHSTDTAVAAEGTPDGTRNRLRNGHRPHRRRRHSSGLFRCIGSRFRRPS